MSCIYYVYVFVWWFIYIKLHGPGQIGYNAKMDNRPTSDSSLKNSWAAHGPGNSNRLEIVFEELFWSKRLFADKIRSERMNFTEI